MNASTSKGPREFLPSQKGWLSRAQEAVVAGAPVHILLTGKVASEVVDMMKRTVARLPLAGIWKGVTRLFPVSGKLPFDPLSAIPMLASIGALGGAMGSVAYVIGLAMSHGVQPQFIYKPGELLFSPEDDELVIVLVPEGEPLRTPDAVG